MRRLTSLLFGIIILIFLGCGQSKSSNSSTTEAGGRSTEKPAKPVHDTVTTETGLKYYDLKVGTGPVPVFGQMIRVHYIGWLSDGTKFQSSRDLDDPIKFPVGMGKVIKGWDEGVASMHQGGIRVLIVPPELAYAERGWGKSIPPNATLIFEVELLEFVDPPPQQG